MLMLWNMFHRQKLKAIFSINLVHEKQRNNYFFDVILVPCKKKNINFKLIKHLKFQ